VKYTTRQIIKTLLNHTLSKKQIGILQNGYCNFKRLATNMVIRREVMPKIDKIKSAFITDQKALFQDFSQEIIEFMKQRKVPGKDFDYFYSANSKQPTLYASAYACMTLSILGRLGSMSTDQKLAWIKHFDGYQNESDGLFYDPVIDSELFRKADWWGARHLALHMVSAYTDLGGRPCYPFRFLEEYYDHNHLKNWLDRVDWTSAISHENDIDNQIMNIGCLLQYQRDAWKDKQAGKAVAYIQKYLLEKINPETGMWGKFNVQDPEQRSRMVQFAYHLFPLFFFDKIQIEQPDKILQIVLKTQNRLGGFGLKLNSSACEDIDSIDIIARLSHTMPERKAEIDIALKKTFCWILCNQVEDGGFVFRYDEAMIYGHEEMKSLKNCGSMFPTWFRTLSLAYLARYFSIQGLQITPSPGLEN